MIVKINFLFHLSINYLSFKSILKTYFTKKKKSKKSSNNRKLIFIDLFKTLRIFIIVKKCFIFDILLLPLFEFNKQNVNRNET